MILKKSTAIDLENLFYFFIPLQKYM